MWQATQFDSDHLVSNFLNTLEVAQKERGEDSLNLLISEIRKRFEAGT